MFFISAHRRSEYCFSWPDYGTLLPCIAYLFKDYFGDTRALSLIGLVQAAATFIAFPLVKPLVSKFGKKELASAGMAVAGGVYLLLFFLKDLTAIEFVAISGFGMFALGFFNLIIWAFVTDVIDYHEFITDLREDATVYSIYSMARKVGQAFAGGIGGYAIEAAGYKSELAVQAPSTLEGIYFLATFVPAANYIVIFLILVFLYPLNKKRTLQLAVDINERRKNMV